MALAVVVKLGNCSKGLEKCDFLLAELSMRIVLLISKDSSPLHEAFPDHPLPTPAFCCVPLLVYLLDWRALIF